MGKPTGFLEYEQKLAEAIEPKERIKNFNEFHTPLSEKEQRKQGGRCMECGVPFCQAGMMIAGMASGCPLNELWCPFLPVRNEYHGNDKRMPIAQSYSRME